MYSSYKESCNIRWSTKKAISGSMNFVTLKFVSDFPQQKITGNCISTYGIIFGSGNKVVTVEFTYLWGNSIYDIKLSHNDELWILAELESVSKAIELDVYIEIKGNLHGVFDNNVLLESETKMWNSICIKEDFLLLTQKYVKI